MISESYLAISLWLWLYRDMLIVCWHVLLYNVVLHDSKHA